jgi:CBS domain-containing protein
MTVAAILKQKGSEVVTVKPTDLVTDIAKIITSRRIGAVLVLTEDGELAGLVSERDVVRAVATDGTGALTLTAADIMTKSLTTVTPRTSIDHAMALMDAGYFRHLPVVEDSKLLGIISVRDVVRGHIQTQEQEVDALREYVHRGAKVDGLR